MPVRVAGYEQEIERLKAQLDRLRRMLFGQSSEKKRHKLENQIRQAEKRLSETGKPAEHSQKSSGRCIVSHRFNLTPVPRQKTRSPVSLNPRDENLHENRCRQNFPGRPHRLLPAETSCPACGGVLKEMGGNNLRATGYH
ncbi:transposase [Shigella flexneri]|uniref:transposase n=1 Tax=Shigella flexneri TaxID=623 RepID=UPI0027D9D4BA|nr:transposase [Shigella flexneri]